MHCFRKVEQIVSDEIMRFRLVKTGKVYANVGDEKVEVLSEQAAEAGKAAGGNESTHPPAATASPGPTVIWSGTEEEYLSLLVMRQAELVAAKAQLAGDGYIDWYTRNRIHDLEQKVSQLKAWLAEARKRTEGDRG